MIHRAGGFGVGGTANNARGDAGDGGVRGHGMEHNGVGADFRARADFDVAEDFRPRANEHAGADLGMAVALLLAGAAKGDGVEDGDVVLDDGGFANDEAGGVVEENATADARGGMDVHREDFGAEALEVEGQLGADGMPKVVGEPVAGERVKAFEIKDGGEEVAAGGVAFLDGEDVGADLAADGGIGAKGFDKKVVKLREEQGVVRELAGEAGADGFFKGSALEKNLLEKRCEHRLACHRGRGLRARLAKL